MRRSIEVLGVAGLLALAVACEEGDKKTDTPEAKTPAAAPSSAPARPPAAAAEAPVPVPADFEAEAETEITLDNYQKELDALAEEIEE